MLHKILQFVANKYQISEDVILNPTKKKESREPRQICMYLAKKHTRFTLSDIGYQYGKKDHSTVSHAIKTIENEMFTNKFVLEVVSEFDAYVQNTFKPENPDPTIQDVINRLRECSAAFSSRKNFCKQKWDNEILIEKLNLMTYIMK
jgi:hypothetical protein